MRNIVENSDGTYDFDLGPYHYTNVPKWYMEALQDDIRKMFPDKNFCDFMQEIIDNVYAHADPAGPPGADGRLAQGPSPIFIPKRKKFKRRYKRC